MIDRLSDLSARRRTLLQMGGLAGALLASGLPLVASADRDNENENEDQGNGPGGLGKKKSWLPVVGTASGGAAFRGLIQLTHFDAVAGSPNSLVASGFLSGVFTNAGGQTIATLRNAGFTAPVTALSDPACQILNLTLGPLTLNLLGLVVNIPNPIVVNITAIPGGGLLGDLLCAVDNLLNGNPLSALLGNLGLLGSLATALNNFFGALLRL